MCVFVCVCVCVCVRACVCVCEYFCMKASTYVFDEYDLYYCKAFTFTRNITVALEPSVGLEEIRNIGLD